MVALSNHKEIREGKFGESLKFCKSNPSNQVIPIATQALHLDNNGLKTLPSTLLKNCTQLSTLDLHGTEITMDILRPVGVCLLIFPHS